MNGWVYQDPIMNNERLMSIPFVPRTQIPTKGHKLMNVDTQCVLARACPFHLLVGSKWGKKYNQKSAYGNSNDGLFEYIANQQINAKLEFSQGLLAVGTTEPYEALSLLENELYKLVYTDPITECTTEHSVHIQFMNMHRNNSAAWV